jgi:protein-disulfide isomerase
METEIKKEIKLSTPMAIIVAGVLIAGAVYFSLNKSTNNVTPTTNNDAKNTAIAPVGPKDNTLGNPKAKVSFILYEDFQCPFCGATAGSNEELIKALKQRDPNWSPFMPEIMNYVNNGDVLFVYRDWPFLGTESIRASEAARCAGDQGKFWDFHDYLYSHQNGENQGGFSDTNLKSFAKTLGLNTTDFDKCFDENKYIQAITDSKTEGDNAGVQGTPKGFILRDGKIVNTVDGAEPSSTVKQKIDAALK